MAGPWTLAATVERPRGDRLLADHGARRELAQALAEGLREATSPTSAAGSPSADIVVQVDEPALPAVMAGQVPTASGFHRHRSVDAPRASPALEWVFAAITESGATPVAHCCASDVPVDLLTGAGAAGVSVDLDVLPVSAYDDLAVLLEQGRPVYLGVVPSTAPTQPLSDGTVAERVLRCSTCSASTRRSASSLVVTPSCGLAGADPQWARRALRICRQVSAALA